MNDSLKVREWADQFPGAGWIYCLYLLSQQSGIVMASGDIAISKVFDGEWNPKEALVIQEMDSKIGAALIEKGATPFILVCLEAPLYAANFYDKKEHYIDKFKYKLGFGLLKDQFTIPASVDKLRFGFPSYYLNEMKEFSPWSGRAAVVLVAANKYFSEKSFLLVPLNFKAMLRMIKMGLLFLTSTSYKKSLTLSLHDKRLELIQFFLEKEELTIYGGGWDDLRNLPYYWRRRLLRRNIAASYMGICKNKKETISKFKFALCLENIESSGYITEKIVDCFVAGTVPIYLGGEDISTHFPNDSFINLRNFSSFDKMAHCMNQIDESRAREMVESGRNFLRLHSAKLNSHEGFSSSIMELVEKC